MNGNSRLGLIAASGIGLLALLTAAASPSALAQSEGGLWEISRAGQPPVRLCLADPAALARIEHRQASCTSDVIRDANDSAVIGYNCAGGDFGRSELKLLTPRSLRVETQGISASAPFKYTFQARRVGNC